MTIPCDKCKKEIDINADTTYHATDEGEGDQIFCADCTVERWKTDLHYRTVRAELAVTTAKNALDNAKAEQRNFTAKLLNAGGNEGYVKFVNRKIV